MSMHCMPTFMSLTETQKRDGYTCRCLNCGMPYTYAEEWLGSICLGVPLDRMVIRCEDVTAPFAVQKH